MTENHCSGLNFAMEANSKTLSVVKSSSATVASRKFLRFSQARRRPSPLFGNVNFHMLATSQNVHR